ncbi:MAG TPA: DUF3048 domain-containing protein [Candidatus Bathyarchaeia archaeon]|nr:DUF3048 domain-containing protein [Candidatus Bathyarchaeia archaeon]
MRAVLITFALLLAACGGSGGPVQVGASSAPAVWPLRGTAASDGDSIHKRPLVIKVANDPAARPQSGMSQADLVLEIPVEGGITRYALVFQSQDPAKVGPVRSARQSDLNYLPALHAILAHVGASESVTQMVRDAAKTGSFVDIDEFQHADAFERVTGKVAPYNAYTSGEKIRAAAGDPGRARVDVPALQFDQSIGKAAGKDATSLVVPYTGAGKVSYAFDPASASYHRTQGATTTMDADAKKEVMPDNVVVIKTEVKEIAGTADVTGAPSVDFRATGTGAVVILRDGKRFDGSWTRTGASDLYRFMDSAGAAIPLKPGLTWIHIVPDDYDLSS